MRNKFLMTLTAALLAACGSEAEVSEGITVDTAATNSRARSVAVSDPTSESKIFRTDADMRIELQAGYLNVLPLELVKDCGTVASLKSFSPLATAYAHAGHGDGASGAGLINVVEPDDTSFALGALPAAPGTYCGVRIGLAPLVVAKHGGDVTPVAGSMLTAYPCYYPSSAGVPEPAAAGTSHTCIKAVVTAAPTDALLRFATPMTVSGSGKSLTLALRYDLWFDGVDMSTLATDSTQQARWAANVMQSVVIKP